MKNITTIVLIVILIVSSIAAMQLTLAFSTPSVPQFTIKQVDRSYDNPTTYTTNHYTGETITHPGYHVTNMTVDVTIKNQAFPRSTEGFNTTGLFYNVQAKNHRDDWSSLYNDDRNKYTIEPSTSEYTIVTFTLNDDDLFASLGEQLDIRVQAVSGTKYTVWSKGGGIIPIGTDFALDKASSWSNTKTITIGSGEVTTNQSAPTSSATQSSSNLTTTQQETNTPPENASQLSLEWVVIVVMALVITALAATLVLTRRKKQ